MKKRKNSRGTDQANISVKIARPQDKKILVDLFFDLLKHLDSMENDMLPTRKNAEFMVNHLLMPAALRKEAILIAWDGSNPVGVLYQPSAPGLLPM